MVQRWSSRFSSPLLMVLATLAVVSTHSCRKHLQVGDGVADPGLAGEPEKYSAVIVRIVDDGTSREASITREARSGELRREEWMEQGQNRALILRPDLGKSFLLDLDRRMYVELEITPGRTGEFRPEARMLPDDPRDSADRWVQAIDRDLDDAPSPARVETRMLPDEVIDGHSCRVYEQRASFPDGHTEVIRTYRALDLAGLALRVEAESEQGALKVITNRREVSIDVAPDTFVVPADFKKVEKLPR